MALRLLARRVEVTTNTPIRACFMSSAPTVPPSKKSTPAVTKADGTPKRESLMSKIATIFGGKIDHVDPTKPGIPMKDIKFANHVDRATGEEKLLLLAFENGIIDPYCNLPVQRTKGQGTKDNPVKVESFFEDRIIACICEPSKNSHRYTTLYKGEKKRCQCGHWLELVDAPRFWEKIPKEDLLEIKFFKDLEDQGKLDKYLQTGELDDPHHGHHH